MEQSPGLTIGERRETGTVTQLPLPIGVGRIWPSLSARISEQLHSPIPQLADPQHRGVGGEDREEEGSHITYFSRNEFTDSKELMLVVSLHKAYLNASESDPQHDRQRYP